MISFLVNSIRIGISILFGTIGESINEKAGHLNLGIPGIMAFGALGGCCGACVSQALAGEGTPIGVFTILFIIVFALIFGGGLGALYSFFTVTLRANQNITGLAITTLGIGCARFFNSLIDSKSVQSSVSAIKTFLPFHDKLGWFGEVFLSWGVLVYIAIFLAIITALFFNKTKHGLQLRAIGENPGTADAVGVNVSAYKYIATIIGCAIAGLGGAYSIIDSHGAADLTNSIHAIEGYGWLAVALVIFCVWKPSLCVLGSLLFGMLYTLGSFIKFNATLTDMIPYVVTIIVLIFTSIFGGKSVQPPASLGLNYFREDR